MDCAICSVRSSVAFCAECHTLLCEECGGYCDECHARVCPAHAHETRHGRTLCVTCYGVYSERRRRREAEADGIEIEPALTPHPGRLSRTRQPLRPWLASLNMALLGAAGILILLFFPSLRRVNFGGPGQGFAMVYVLVILPFLAVAWAFLGLFTRWSRDAKSLNLIGLSIAAATIVLAFYAVRPVEVQGSREATGASGESGPLRSNLTKEELEGWRADMLHRYEGTNAPKADVKKPINLNEVAPPPSAKP